MRIKKTTFLFFLWYLLTLTANAQQTAVFDANKLSIEWKFGTNFYQQKDQSSATLVITNTDKSKMLPVSGWVIYFNAVRSLLKQDEPEGLELSRINGDLFSLKPNARFKGLAPQSKISLPYISQYWIHNISEAPTGFYLVWDNEPVIAHNITQVKALHPASDENFKTSATDKSLHVSPEKIYEQNKLTKDIPENQLCKIFPTPVSYIEKSGTFTLNVSTAIKFDKEYEQEASYFRQELKDFISASKSAMKTEARGNIQLKYNATLKPEAYQLQVSPDAVIISASTPKGIFYGWQSFKCLFPLAVWKQTLNEMRVPAVEVSDEPRFAYRGLMLDVARNFHSKESIMKLLDYMALYKLNVLHFHFSDDEAWRIEIPGLPELTSVGVKRGHSHNNNYHLPPTYGSGGPANERQSGFYTRNEYIALLKYAKERHIEVIPEIETPGHARAAVKAMLARYEQLMKEGKKKEAEEYLLTDLNDKSVYETVQHFSDNVMCVGLPSVYKFIEKVSDELISMHKEAGQALQTLHLGGDEVAQGVWENSPVCTAFLKDNPQYANAADLWNYYWKQVYQLIAGRGLYLSGWEEMAMRPTKMNGKKTMMVNPDFANANFHTYVWNNAVGFGCEDLPYRLANGGYKVILCPVSNLYFDLAYQKDFNEPGYYWGGFVDVDKPFYFIPYDYYKNTKFDRNGLPVDSTLFIGKDHLSDYGKQNIMGIQGHLWSENLRSQNELEYQAFPKFFGLAERAWAPDPDWAVESNRTKSDLLYQEAWSKFVNIIGKREINKISWYKGGMHYRIPTVGVKRENNTLLANCQFPGFQIRYTTDGSEPTIKSPLYTVPLSVKGIVTFRAFDEKGRGGRSVKTEN